MEEQTDRVTLRHGEFELELCPEGGGCITGFRHRGHDLMRPALPGYWQEKIAGQSSCYPLVPFSNRIADGRLIFEGRNYQLPINWPAQHHAIHGQGWQSAWRAERHADSALSLHFDHRVDGTPFDYQAAQHFQLLDRGLEVRMEVTNTGEGAMPAGLGLHPYFPKTDGMTLQAAVDHVWLADQRQIPTNSEPVPEPWNFSHGRQLAPLVLDHCFGGFGGRARIEWPETGQSLVIETDPLFGHLVVFVPPGKPYVCIEPVSHANDGFNLAARNIPNTGTHRLAPGDTLSGRIGFYPA